MNRNPKRPEETGTTHAEREIENYVGIPLTEPQREKLQELVSRIPNRTEEQVAAFALEMGVDQCLEFDDELQEEQSMGLVRIADSPTAQEEVALLARAFQVREQLKTPSSLSISLSTMDRYAVDQLVAATGMKLDEVVKMIVAKGIAQMTKEHGVEKGTPRTIEVGAGSVPSLDASRHRRIAPRS